ncbi:hypothetical protein MAR_037564, partial [Mya arenaria]
ALTAFTLKFKGSRPLKARHLCTVVKDYFSLNPCVEEKPLNPWLISEKNGGLIQHDKDIDFTSMRSLKRKYENVEGDIPPIRSRHNPETSERCANTNRCRTEWILFKLSAYWEKSSHFNSLMTMYRTGQNGPTSPLGNLKTKDAMMMNMDNLTVSKEQIANVEEVTRNQSESKLGQSYRAGVYYCVKSKASLLD